MTRRTGGPSAESYTADRHELIRVHFGCENNLRDDSVEIPKRLLGLPDGSVDSGRVGRVIGHHQAVMAAYVGV